MVQEMEKPKNICITHGHELRGRVIKRREKMGQLIAKL